MGQQTGDQASLFYEFRLDDRIPRDHLFRRINVPALTFLITPTRARGARRLMTVSANWMAAIYCGIAAGNC
jgi:hypothetical protein